MLVPINERYERHSEQRAAGIQNQQCEKATGANSKPGLASAGPSRYKQGEEGVMHLMNDLTNYIIGDDVDMAMITPPSSIMHKSSKQTTSLTKPADGSVFDKQNEGKSLVSPGRSQKQQIQFTSAN